MKYRIDFVTNSSSTSFAGSILESLASLLTVFGCGEEGEGEEEEGSLIYMEKTKMPQAGKIEYGQEDVYLYARLMQDTEKETIVLEEPTGEINFEVLEGKEYATIGDLQMVEDFKCAQIIAINYEGENEPPKNIKIKARVPYLKKVFSALFTVPLVAPPKLSIAKSKCEFLTKTNEELSIDFKVSNPGEDEWNFYIEPDDFALDLCSYNIEIDSKKSYTGKLVITESDTEEISGNSTDHYSKGRLVLKGSNGKVEVEDYIDVYVWREGLFLIKNLDYDRESGEILLKASKDENENMKKNNFDLRYMTWDEKNRTLKCDTDIFKTDSFNFEEPEPKDDKAESIFENTNAIIEFEGERPSNLPSGKFNINMDKVIPGKKGERYKFDINAVLDDSINYYNITIPFAIVPAFMEDINTDWNKEYEYCLKIINEFLPSPDKEKRLIDLENGKHYMGSEDIKRFRKDTWDIAYDILVKQRQNYEDIGNWYDNAVYWTEWVQWLNDRAFSMVLGTLTGPTGALVIGQGKMLLQDIIEKVILVKESDTWGEIVYDIIFKRFSDTLGGVIDNKYFDSPERIKKFIIGYYFYKVVWHWAWDYENNQRKGLFEAVKSAASDLGGAGLEAKLKPYVEGMAKREGYGVNEDIDKYVEKMIIKIAEYISPAIPHVKTFINDEGGTSH